jgi:Fic family protein
MMTFISKKLINGKERFYLEKSIRFPNGKIKKFSIYLKDKNKTKEENKKLEEKILEELKNHASNYYKTNTIFNKQKIRNLEEIRINYKKIKNKLTKNQITDILDRFTVNFTYESNAIEGNSLTLKDVTFIIKEGKVIKNKDLREVYETLNTRKAIGLLFQNKLKLNQKNIIKLHSILVENTGIETGFKKLPNFLLGRKVKTTPPERVEKEINKLITWYNENKNLHPLHLAAIFHAKFEQIHPFEDGNGRIGRLLINLILLEQDYAPLIIRKSQRIAYLVSLEAFDNKYPDKLFRFLLEKYKDTYEKFFKIYIKYL